MGRTRVPPSDGLGRLEACAEPLGDLVELRLAIWIAQHAAIMTRRLTSDVVRGGDGRPQPSCVG
jgi:hypothetical protein